MSKYKECSSTDLTFSVLQEAKSRRESFLNSVSGTFSEFSRSTSIHGFKYLGNSQGSRFEKIWWILVLSGCIYLCTVLTFSTLKKREENPVFISFRQSPMHIWDIPLPAITICPASKIKATKYNFTFYSEKYKRNNLTTDERKHFLDMNEFCKNGYVQHFTSKSVSEHTMDKESINHFIEHSLSLEDVLDSCRILQDPFNCTELFSPILTNSGLCFSFNMLDKSELFENITYQPEKHGIYRKAQFWSPDNNYVKTLNSTVPMRLISVNQGLYFSLRTTKSHNIDKLCEKNQGYKIIFHHPAETPTLSHRYLLLSTKENYKVWIKPDITVTSKNLEDYLPDKRGCYFSQERTLKFFKIYTEQNCLLECMSNHTFEKCSCIPYFLPHETTGRICGLTDKSCVYHAKEELLSRRLMLEVLGDGSKKHNLSDVCGCLPSCTSIVYDAEIVPKQPSKFSRNATLYTSVYITFKDSKFITMQRNELFSNADFWASCGGLFGLFTGFSVVSLAEIIYFATLKWMYNFWNMRERVW